MFFKARLCNFAGNVEDYLSRYSSAFELLSSNGLKKYGYTLTKNEDTYILMISQNPFHVMSSISGKSKDIALSILQEFEDKMPMTFRDVSKEFDDLIQKINV